MRSHKRRKQEKLKQIRRGVFEVITVIGVLGILGTIGSSDMGTVSVSQMCFQLGLFGLITTIGIKFSDIMKYQFDKDTGNEWYED